MDRGAGGGRKLAPHLPYSTSSSSGRATGTKGAHVLPGGHGGPPYVSGQRRLVHVTDPVRRCGGSTVGGHSPQCRLMAGSFRLCCGVVLAVRVVVTVPSAGSWPVLSVVVLCRVVVRRVVVTVPSAGSWPVLSVVVRCCAGWWFDGWWSQSPVQAHGRFLSVVVRCGAGCAGGGHSPQCRLMAGPFVSRALLANRRLCTPIQGQTDPFSGLRHNPSSAGAADLTRAAAGTVLLVRLGHMMRVTAACGMIFNRPVSSVAELVVSPNRAGTTG